MVTKIKNASSAKLRKVNIKYTKTISSILNILYKEGFIELENKQSKNFISIKLKYKGMRQIPYITNIIQISKPGVRVFVNKKEIPKVWGGIGLCLFFVTIFRII